MIVYPVRERARGARRGVGSDNRGNTSDQFTYIQNPDKKMFVKNLL
jgi:hypothetical protein